MKARLLVVCSGEREVARGSCWCLERECVVTAFHVVGERAPGRIEGRWLSDNEPSIRYWLRTPGESRDVELTPLMRDSRADVALLVPEQPGALAHWPASRLANGVATGASWKMPAFPAFHSEQPLTLSGRVIDIGVSEDRALQLLIEQGTETDWAGISGAPLVGEEDKRVIGLVTQVTYPVHTGWAAHADSVRALWELATAPDLRKDSEELLTTAYAERDALLAWAQDVQPFESEPPTTLALVATSLVATAFANGPPGVQRMLDEIERDRPGLAALRSLRARLQRAPAPRLTTSRSALAREIVQRLLGQDSGVALLEPFGFGAREVVQRVIEMLMPPESRLLPIRLVPDRRTLDEKRLYGALLRDLGMGLDCWFQSVPQDIRDLLQRYHHPSSESFEELIEALVTGPLARRGFKLTLVVEGLARVERQILESFGYLMARLARQGMGLKLVASGSEELYLLRTEPRDFSVFHELFPITLGPLTDEDVDDAAQRRLGAVLTAQAREVLMECSGGHPTLVSELLKTVPELVSQGDRPGLDAALGTSEHLERLRRLLSENSEGQKALCTMLRNQHSELEQREVVAIRQIRCLEWLGILREEQGDWRCVAPALCTLVH